MISSKEIEQKIDTVKPVLKQEYGVERIGYFANNTQTEQSDVDILVNLSKGVGWRFFDLKDYLEGIFIAKLI